jgi:hypothetical protein
VLLQDSEDVLEDVELLLALAQTARAKRSSIETVANLQSRGGGKSSR